MERIGRVGGCRLCRIGRAHRSTPVLKSVDSDQAVSRVTPTRQTLSDIELVQIQQHPATYSRATTWASTIERPSMWRLRTPVPAYAQSNICSESNYVCQHHEALHGCHSYGQKSSNQLKSANCDRLRTPPPATPSPDVAGCFLSPVADGHSTVLSPGSMRTTRRIGSHR